MEETSSSNLDAIRSQVEFYFSDSNIVRDRHLKLRIAKHPEGYVELEHLLTFNRLKNLTTDMSVLRNALRESSSLEMNDDETLVRRRNALPSDTKYIDERTVYAKEFPADVTVDDLLTFWRQHASVKGVFMRRERGNKAFKGSVFVECASPEEAQELSKKDLEYNGQKLTMYMKLDWIETKKSDTSSSSDRNKISGESSSSTHNNDESVDEPLEFTSGLVVRLSGFPGDISRNEIQDAMTRFGDVHFVDFDLGSSEAFVRFGDCVAASESVRVAASPEDGGVKIGDSSLTISLLTGEEETNYWMQIQRLRKMKHSSRGNRKRGAASRDQDRGEKRSKS